MGVIAYEMACLQLPFQAKDMQQLYKKVIKGEYRSIPRQYSNSLRIIIDSMLTVKPKNRVSIKELLEMPILCKIGFEFGLKMPNKETSPSPDTRTPSTQTNTFNELLKTIYSKKSLA